MSVFLFYILDILKNKRKVTTCIVIRTAKTWTATVKLFDLIAVRDVINCIN